MNSQVLTWKYRILPTKAQHRALALILESQRQLYNAALEERIEAWRRKDRLTGKGVSRSCFDQFRALTECRAHMPEMAALPVNIQRGTLRRLHKAFEEFYARVRKGATPGFPRFKGRGRWNSFEFLEFDGIRFDGRVLRSKAFPGALRVHLHRPLPNASFLSARFRRDLKGWFVSFSIKVDSTAPRVGNRVIGIDVGVGSDNFAVGDAGQRIPNRHAAKRAAAELRRRQRALARCKRDSLSGRKTRARLARTHAKVANQRTNHLHQTSAHLVANYNRIAVEDLKIAHMVRSAKGTVGAPGKNVKQKSGLNRAIADAAWGRFIEMLSYKAARAGAELIKVDPKYTSQTCPCCSHVAAGNRPTRDRFHCLKCGFEEDADVVGARNILARAGMGPGVLNVAHQGERAPGNLTPGNG